MVLFFRICTNTFDAAELSVTKRVVNPRDPNATYTFDVACTMVGDGTPTDVPVISGSSPIVISGGQTASVTVLVGSRCVVTERNVPGAPVTITESGDQVDANATDGIVTVAAAASVIVTNSFPSSTGAGGGILPGTGNTGLGSMLIVAVVLLCAGAALVVFRRRSNRPSAG